MKPITFVLGGCRSGKSSHALEMANRIPGKRVFVATCVPQDAEMDERVRRHQAQRGRHWVTVEAPIFLSEEIQKQSHIAKVVLVDCLTLWISNLLIDGVEADRIDQHIDSLVAALQGSACPVILVSNEVGMGIVPENPLARRYRDQVGIVNQRVAECADQVIMTVAGLTMVIK